MRYAAWAAAAASLALVTGLPLLAHADGSSGSGCSGVWVTVGEAAPRCATDHATGAQALRSAGFVLVERAPGLICQIDGVPEACTVSVNAYWSYWQAGRRPDGSWEDWRYSSVGASLSTPRAGDAEGWAFGDGRTPPPPLPQDPAPLPQVVPAAAPATGSPMDTVVTLGLLGLGGAGLGGWWLRTRRGN